MSFPPRDIVTELFVNGTWTDVSGDRRVADPVMIERGRKNEGSKPEPSVCSLTLDNRHGHYSPRNPIGPYYGDIGRNTPLRVSVRAASDSFARTVVDGWGSADSGHAWTIDGVGGTVADSDWQVNGGVGTQSVPVAAALRESYLATTSLRLVDVLIDVTLPFSDVTGGSVEPANVMLRGQAPDDYYVVRVEITTAEAVTIGLQHFDGTVIAAQVTVAGLTHTSAQALRVRAQAEGHTLRAKVWAATGSEPYGWQVSAHTESITGAGWVGIRSGVSAGNTNAKPIVFAYDNFELRVPRFAGELSALPQRWDLSGNDAWVPVEAAGITQRLGQGVSPLHSTLYRGTSRLVVPPVAYWPCEDGEEATAISSALPGVGSMYVAGPTEFASYDDIPASEPLPIVGEAAWVGSIPFYTGTGKVQLRYLLHVPAAEIVDRGLISQMHVSGTTSHWEIKYRTGGALSLEAWTQDHQLLLDTGPIGFTTLDRNVMISLALEQDGPHIDWNLAVLEVGQTFGLFSAGTLTNRTIDRALAVRISPYGQLIDTAVGHISVRKEVSSLFDLASELNAFDRERAGDRLQRLCSEEGISFSHVGALGSTARMGPQRPSTLLTLLRECADADLGTLYEPRGELGIVYRTHDTLYHQSPAMTLGYGGGQIAAPFEPSDDDQLTRNDITASRAGGGSARAELTTGRMSVLDPADGGVGRYDTSVTVNVADDAQLPDIAGWLLHEGTVDETRYPRVRVNLATPAVAADPALPTAALQLDIDDRVLVSDPRPDQTPDDITQLARGYSETINIFEHTITLNAAPESPYQVLTFDDPESRFDTDGSDLTAGITSSATSFSVDVPSGPLWTTDAADMPIRFRLGGEEISVGAISGAASPQTFSSVTRSVNGVSKSHGAGTPVELASPAVVAL